jgi:replicative DNA helicase
MLTASEAGKEPDESIVISELQKSGELERIGGGADYVFELRQNSIRRSSVHHHCEAVKEAAKKRSLGHLCKAVAARTVDAQTSLEDCMEGLNDSMLSLTAETFGAQVQTPKQLTVSLLDEILVSKNGEGALGLPTGLQELDDATTGIREGEFWVIGALPGRGKTSLALQTAATNARNGVPVGIFSLEMTAKQCLKRLWANEASNAVGSRLTASKLRDPKWLSGEAWAALHACAERVADWPIYIDDSSSLKVSELTARARLMIKRHGVKLILVDYLRLVDAPQKELRERVGYVADSLRRLAKETKVPVVALSQLRRPQDINSRPTMLDLKESGDCESASHVVALLYTPMDNGRPTGEDEVIIGKNREGEMGPIAVTYDRDHLIFVPREVR